MILSDFGLSRVAEQLENAAKDSIRLAASEPSKAAVSRLFGRPNLPAGVDWPTSADGPLAFVAQLDLGNLPKIHGLGLPCSGSLFFFFCGVVPHEKSKERERFRVLYFDRPLTEFPERNFPKDLPSKLRWKGLQYAVARTEISFPWPEDTVVEQLDLNEQEYKDFCRFSGHWIDSPGEPRSLHRIGGYPNYVQHDPKFEAHLRSRDLWAGICDNPDNLSAEEHFRESNRRFSEIKRRLKPEAAAWELLLQVDSEENAGMMWGDTGRLYFLIRQNDLHARRFENTWMVWDCY